MNRIDRLLKLEEVAPSCMVEQKKDQELAISIDNQSFSWGISKEEDVDTDDEAEKKKTVKKSKKT
jgi:hypothetical protein